MKLAAAILAGAALFFTTTLVAQWNGGSTPPGPIAIQTITPHPAAVPPVTGPSVPAPNVPNVPNVPTTVSFGPVVTVPTGTGNSIPPGPRVTTIGVGKQPKTGPGSKKGPDHPVETSGPATPHGKGVKAHGDHRTCHGKHKSRHKSKHKDERKGKKKTPPGHAKRDDSTC